MKATRRPYITSRSLTRARRYTRYTSSAKTMTSATDISSTDEYMSRPSTQVNRDMLAEAQPRTNAARKEERRVDLDAMRVRVRVCGNI